MLNLELNFAFLVWRFAVVWKGVLLKYDLCLSEFVDDVRKIKKKS